ncbi:Phosphoribosylaminoimidazole carboxylase catalytic subunit [Aequoribacter fuscus]|uniref:N5-carboxyaminoimidazole ribonucleotide mutase n=1 Tax=Aequoribacter fuscus TaxID=2518989 RepID=F3L0B3_9GAMM|nr:5-(carboxyamino)imidazole ribonucleotide mutase [Aequoribacter fuscus]EGG30223.1 Phosphoribosylaminoimidazole carboxylase catalytic subunit [Aequoribacter fuscus]QHJ86948.1 5-(carboxyamino)imidazole ribonucleotide mutase [Aequoribacter fuscus]
MDILPAARVTIVMGSQSDWPTLQEATTILGQLNVDHACGIVSAHRTPDRLYEFARGAEKNGVEIIIAGAGGSAHLPGMIASMTSVPVIAVPVESKFNQGLDSLLSIVQMPRGVAVATQAVGGAGAFNAGVMAVQMLAIYDHPLRARFKEWRLNRSAEVAVEIQS